MSYADEGNKAYWDAVRAGEIEHKGRGKDQKARAPKDKKSFEKRYYCLLYTSPSPRDS